MDPRLRGDDLARVPPPRHLLELLLERLLPELELLEERLLALGLLPEPELFERLLPLEALPLPLELLLRDEPDLDDEDDEELRDAIACSFGRLRAVDFS